MKKVLIFDFDGTIADSLDAIMRITNRLSGRYGIRRITDERRDQLRHETSQRIMSDFRLSPWRLFLIAVKVKAELRREIKDVKLISGMKHVLLGLHGDGYRLGIATSNSKATVEDFLQNHNLENCFDFIFARTVFGKASILKAILRKYRLKRKEVLYIGDETRDIDAARQAGVGVISVTWGINSEEILRSHKPDHLITEPASIHKILSS